VKKFEAYLQGRKTAHERTAKRPKTQLRNVWQCEGAIGEIDAMVLFSDDTCNSILHRLDGRYQDVCGLWDRAMRKVELEWNGLLSHSEASKKAETLWGAMQFLLRAKKWVKRNVAASHTARENE
jgi:hypothetical protein